MSLPLYTDHNVHGGIIAGLRRRGIDCPTAEQDGMAQVADDRLLARATELGRALFTHDDDLLAITADWLDAGRDFAGVIYAPQLGVTIGRAVAEVELILNVFDKVEMTNRVELVPL